MGAGFFIEDGESFSDAWKRCWYADTLGDGAYGQRSVIARIRRGKWVVIPAEWRGKVTHPQTVAKRESKMTRKARNERHAIRNPRVRSDARAPKASDWA